jgi:hypothetical protein
MKQWQLRNDHDPTTRSLPGHGLQILQQHKQVQRITR